MPRGLVRKHAHPRRLAALGSALRTKATHRYSAPEFVSPVTVIMPLAPKDVDSAVASLGSLHNSGLDVASVVVACSPGLTSGMEAVGPLVLEHDEALLCGGDSFPSELVLGGKDRSGWMRQQLLKLQLAAEAETEYVLWLDADTIFLRAPVFIHRGRQVLHVAKEYHAPYQRNINELIPGLTPQSVSYVTHMMLVRRSHVRALVGELGARGEPWECRILCSLDSSEASGFSEYDLYSRFVLSRFPREYTVGWRAHKNIGDISELTRLRRGRYVTVSVHKRAV